MNLSISKNKINEIVYLDSLYMNKYRKDKTNSKILDKLRKELSEQMKNIFNNKS